jgi:hypothetical protein
VGTEPWPRKSASEQADDLSERPPAAQAEDRPRQDQRS